MNSPRTSNTDDESKKRILNALFREAEKHSDLSNSSLQHSSTSGEMDDNCKEAWKAIEQESIHCFNM